MGGQEEIFESRDPICTILITHSRLGVLNLYVFLYGFVFLRCAVGLCMWYDYRGITCGCNWELGNLGAVVIFFFLDFTLVEDGFWGFDWLL